MFKGVKEYLPEAANDSCTVCLEDTNTVTEYGDHLCCDCLIETCKNNNDEKMYFHALSVEKLWEMKIKVSFVNQLCFIITKN